MEPSYWIPIHLSAANGHLEVVKLLLERGADVHAVNGEGETPYQVSLRRGHREIADLLWKHGAGRLGDRFDGSFYDLNALYLTGASILALRESTA